MIRNFWLEAYIDGRKTNMAGGPRAKDGGFTQIVYMRQKGMSVEALRITGREHNGKLELDVFDNHGKHLFFKQRER